MFRVFKITSPMSVGSWLLGAVASTAVVSAADSVLGLFPRLALAAKPTAVATGLPLATYTAALISNTSVPVWSEARMTLPFVFASGAAASAGAAAVLVTPEKHAGPARRLAVGGAIAELGSTRLMEERLGDELASPYHEGAAGASSRAAQLLTAAGGMVLGGWGRGRRRAAAAGAGMIMAGALLERWAVYKAGFQSAADPKHTVAPQRRRIEQGETPGASRRAGQAKP
jgi:hypothetical protein